MGARAETGGGLVLVVDDDASIRLLLREIVATDGWRAVEAADGASALAMAAEHRPDAVLLDVGLPDMDGIAVLERLKSDPTVASIPVVMVTAWGEADRVERAAAAGAHAYVRKPFEARQVLQALAAVSGEDRAAP